MEWSASAIWESANFRIPTDLYKRNNQHLRIHLNLYRPITLHQKLRIIVLRSK